jgi:hypothetical protein
LLCTKYTLAPNKQLYQIRNSADESWDYDSYAFEGRVQAGPPWAGNGTSEPAPNKLVE